MGRVLRGRGQQASSLAEPLQPVDVLQTSKKRVPEIHVLGRDDPFDVQVVDGEVRSLPALGTLEADQLGGTLTPELLGYVDRGFPGVVGLHDVELILDARSHMNTVDKDADRAGSARHEPDPHLAMPRRP